MAEVVSGSMGLLWQRLKSLFGSRRSVQALGLVIALIAVMIYFRLKVDQFWGPDNLLDLLRQSSINTLLAVGVTFVILTAGIDLSVGSILCLSTIVLALVLRAGAPPAVGIAAGMLAGTLCGILNGGFVVAGRLSPFIATLGTLWALRGLARWICNDRTILIANDPFMTMGTARPLGVPMPVIVACIAVIAAEVVLKRTIFGRCIFAVGGSEEASWVSGVRVGWIKASVYAISGLTAGIAAVLSSMKLGTGSPTVGVAYELDAIAAVVLGGTSLMGGEGSAVGTFVGAVFIQALRKGMSMTGVEDYRQNIAIGVAIVIGALVDRSMRRR